ncbi:MAG: hypothetical protein K6F00_06205 [Lachnospiraceae bacterium]|nr:hypothetical protein [Lachnospiraceae bacterium]
MQYSINKYNYHSFNIYEDNKLPARAYFIPYKDKESESKVELSKKRYSSDKVRVLSGEWDFKFYPLPSELPDVFDTEEEDFDKVAVPGCWQFQGYYKPFYLNTRFQFPYNPPEIPKEEAVGKTFSWGGADLGVRPRWQTPENEYNFVGVYRTGFNIEEISSKAVISFLGVASCLDFYINGYYVGYSEGSHNVAEFDITDYIAKGENEILAVVHRWCNGTYLEAQDMFRNNGIFRDVLLYEFEKEDVYDVEVKTVKVGGKYDLTLDVSTISDTKVKVELTGENVDVSAEETTVGLNAGFAFTGLEPREWNAEYPNLYDLYITTESCCVHLRVGFKDIRIKGSEFYFNDKLVKFKGVNHHDTSATAGYTMTPEEIETDVRLCKEFNIDTIRTSHYPPDPYLLELCDELGIYVVDEADIETHGVFFMHLPPTYNLITKNKAWEERYVDRVSRMYQRDKNHTCIFMWSLGNESGGDYCTDKEYEYLKQHTDIPVHYESCIHSGRKAYDVGSQMYPPVDRVHAVGEKTCEVKELNDRPYFLCEYAHAMGVGPGGIEDYWQEIFSYDNLMGGCVWEMVDHAVLENDGNYTYGGDHGEWMHDGNFCVDGIFYPDRTPSTGADIVKFTYRPIRVRRYGKDKFEFFNTTGFTDGSNYEMTFRWSDGGYATITPDVAPGEKKVIEVLPQGVDENYRKLDGDILVTIETVDKRDEREVAVEQLKVRFNNVYLDTYKRAPRFPEGFGIKPGEPATILYRVGTDNDVDLLGKDIMEPYYDQTEKIISYKSKKNKILIRSEVRNKKGIFLCSDYYEAIEGGVLVRSRIVPIRVRGDLPRYGKTFKFTEDFDIVEYQGRIGESYGDMKQQYPIGIVKTTVSAMTEPNIRPQESGNRCDTTWVKISNGKKTYTFRTLDEPFELGVKPYSDAELINMKHRIDEKRTGSYVTLSAFQMGIGTGSCGPATTDEFKYSARNTYELNYIIEIED